MWVAKLGGSLSRDALLPRWLDLLAGHGAGCGVVVPGGGPFADLARDTQSAWGLDDLTAHNMAVLGMAQTALLLHALCGRLQLARSEAEIHAVLRRGGTALWMPLDLLREEPDELTHWGVTSDSLALRLAQRLHAQRLVVVKSCAIEAGGSLQQAGEAGVLDADFAVRARWVAFPIELLERNELARAEALLRGTALPPKAP